MTGPEAAASGDALVRASEANACGYISSILEGVAGVALHMDNDVFRFASGKPYAITNGVLRSRFAESQAERAIAASLAWFRARNVPFMWMAWPDASPPDLGARLLNAGLVSQADLPLMVAPTRNLPLETLPDGVHIERVATREGRSAWIDALAEGYDAPRDAAALFAGSPARAGRLPSDPLQLYVATRGESAVGCAAAYSGSGVVGIYTVAVLASSRRAGIGSALTLACMQEGVRHGCAHAVLQASEMGVPVYERLGFSERGLVRVYGTPPAIVSGS